MTMPNHPHVPKALSLTRAVGIDLAMLLFGGGAIVLSFLTGQGADRWQNLAFPPIIMVLAATTLRLVLAEVRTLWRVLPDHPYKGEALAALGVAIVMAVVVGPMLLIMPFIFFAAVGG